jgi:hypothetical protein
MILELGNANAAYFDEESSAMKAHDLDGAPAVTRIVIGHQLAEHFDYDLDIAAHQRELFKAVIRNKGVTNHVAAGVTRPKVHAVRVDDTSEETVDVEHHDGAAALEYVVHPDGGFSKNSLDGAPTWVYSPDDEAFGRLVAAWYEVPYGRPDDVYETHWTHDGGAPGAALRGPTALLVNTGRDLWAKTQGMFGNVLAQQTATASSATSLTATGTPLTASGYVGYIVSDNTTGVWAMIQSNTSSVLTVDRWYNPATPAGAAATTPGATDKFTIYQAVPPAQFIAISTTNTASVSTDTTMAGEITTSGGGCVRTQATYTHTAGTNTYTMGNTWTANASDTGSLPYVVARMGLFSSMVVSSTIAMWFETLFNATATLTVSGDAVTGTDTITGS